MDYWNTPECRSWLPPPLILQTRSSTKLCASMGSRSTDQPKSDRPAEERRTGRRLHGGCDVMVAERHAVTGNRIDTRPRIVFCFTLPSHTSQHTRQTVSRRSRFLQNTVASQTESSADSPTNQRNKRL